VFPLIATYWDQAAAMVRYIGEEEGGLERLRSKKIALLHHDSTFGREPIPVLGELAKKYGYQLATIPVAPPGIDQHAQWTQIRELRPDWVILWGSGAMNPTALQGAAKIGYPRGRMLGVWWSGAEQDVLPAGMAAKDFMAAEFAVAGRAYPVIAEIEKHVYGEGSGRMDDAAAMGSISYNRGVVLGILTAEAVRVAQNRFGKGRPVTGQQLQWALEHLRLDERRLKQLGAAGFMPAIDTSCTDHAGAGGVRFVRWDGSRWYAVTGWIEALPGDREMLRAKYAESAMRYAQENNIKPRKCPAA
jgi:branched-chain amino acid transport system substrate-binding protein